MTETAADTPLPVRDQPHAALIIQRCYSRFLAESNDNEDREYPDAADQIREMLIHGNYLSQKDLDICWGFDLIPWQAIRSMRTCANYTMP